MHQQSNGTFSSITTSNSTGAARSAEEDIRPSQQRNQVYPPLAHDRAIARITQHICGVLALQSGFSTSSVSALARLGDMALAHMNEICRITKNLTENTGRTIPINKDVELALRYLNVPEMAMIEEIEKLKTGMNKIPTMQVRNFNAPPQPKIFRVGGDSNTRPSHIPNFLPPFPDPHTYVQTEISCEPDVSYAKHREMCANHQRNADNLLISLLTTRYPIMSLYNDDNEKSKDGQTSKGKILMPFEDYRPYLTALLPSEALDELDM